MATYGPKLSMALFASFMFSLLLIHHKVACDEPDKDNEAIEKDKRALLDFIRDVKKSEDVNWDESTNVCGVWKGIKCDSSKSYVSWIQLPSKSLLGQIPENTIGRLEYLSVLSLHGNGLSGPIPPDFSTLKYLIQFELHSNSFTGQLPYIDMTNMDVRNFNVSNNNLSGAIPSSLSNCDKSSFTQNIKLCGPPLDNPCPNGTERPPEPSTPAPVSSPENKPENKLPKGARIGIAVGSPLLVLFLLSCLRKDIHLQQHAQIPESSKDDKLIEGGPADRNKFEDGIYSFGLEDLLWASAADLGEGRIGTTYKALMIKEGAVVVVKRLKDVVVTKKEFESQMKILGKMKNQNVVPLRAYHWSEDHEKLLVYDYMPAGSVYDLLHGSGGSGQTPLDWKERMQIALSAARGLAYLHFTEKLVHGNFKSSNILLRQETNKEAAVSDYGLNMLSARSSFPIVTFKSDVYSFGVFLLELLTRKVPNQALLGEEGIDLPRWVESFAREEWKTKVFDTELMSYQNVEEQMVQLLQIAMACASFVLDQRPPMHEVVRMIEHMNPNTLSIVTPAWE